MAKFDLNDDGVVVIVGSGAGGGTLGNELAQKGVKVVILEAGARNEIQDFVNNEWDSFTQLAWKDFRTTSGSWRVARVRQARIQYSQRLWRSARRQYAGLADHAGRDGAMVRQGRKQDGRH